MLRSQRLSLPLVLVLATLCLGASSAFAAPAPWKSVDVVLLDDPSGPVLIVSGQLADDVTLPAEAVLTAPSGLQLQWAGEVLGGPMDQDPSITPRVQPSGAMDAYSFTMTQGRRAQVELSAPTLIADAQGSRAARVSWVAPRDVPVVNVMVRVPDGSRLVTASAGSVVSPGPTGFEYYQRTFENVKAGSPLDLGVTFTPAAAVGGGTAGASTPSGNATGQAVPILLFVAIIVAGVALAVSVRRKMAERAGVQVESDAESAAEHPSASLSPRSSGADVEAAEISVSASGSGRRVPRGLLAAGIIVAFVVGAGIAVNATTKPQVVGGKITQQIAQVDQCTSATFPLQLPDGTKLEEAADEIFAVLRTTQGVGQVTVYADQPRIEVGYCESSNSEQALRQALVPTGYITAQ